MANLKRSKRLNRVLKTANHLAIGVCIIGVALIVALVQGPYVKKVDLKLAEISTDQLFQEAINTAQEMGYKLVGRSTEPMAAECAKAATWAKSTLRIEAQEVEDYKTGEKHHWVSLNVRNEGFTSKFKFRKNPQEICEEFLRILDSRLMELI